jgi:hypothetical protein
MPRGWPFVFPVGGVLWWLLGFPPGWGWMVAPMFPQMPVSLGMLIVLVALVGGLAFAVKLGLENL